MKIMMLWTGIILFSSILSTLGENQEISFATARPWDEYSGWPYCELGGTYSMPHKKYCDRFFVCQNGQAYLGQCADGLAFMSFNGCKYLHLVNCTGRPNLQAPKGQGNCPRLNGLYKDSKGCGSYFKCENGTAIPDKCSEGLEFDEETKLCRVATPEEKGKCSEASSTSSGFKCPENDILPFGDHSRHPYPGNCYLFIICLRDGSMKVGSCGGGTAYSPATHNCEVASSVPGCAQTSR
ncbi:protein obstructor-E-like [Periplaneta americana]|uniref:protein obstructor-E-like n=1 Tax=Periplaneta americana TaxID=6978 RepID=UPI0037E7889D